MDASARQSLAEFCERRVRELRGCGEHAPAIALAEIAMWARQQPTGEMAEGKGIFAVAQKRLCEIEDAKRTRLLNEGAELLAELAGYSLQGEHVLLAERSHQLREIVEELKHVRT